MSTNPSVKPRVWETPSAHLDVDNPNPSLHLQPPLHSLQHSTNLRCPLRFITIFPSILPTHLTTALPARKIRVCAKSAAWLQSNNWKSTGLRHTSNSLTKKARLTPNACRPSTSLQNHNHTPEQNPSPLQNLKTQTHPDETSQPS